MACDPQLRSCILAAFYRRGQPLTVYGGSYRQAMMDLGLDPDSYSRRQVRRALDSLAFNSNPSLRRLTRHAGADTDRYMLVAGS